MINSKKAFMAISMSIVLSSYLYANTCNKDGDNWIVQNANADGDYSLSACITEARYDEVDGSRIIFDGNYTINLTNQIDILDYGIVTIDGGTHNIVINGTTDTRIFEIKNSSKTTLQNLTLQNGDKEHGGAISLYQADVDIQSCILTKNMVETVGGAILSDASTLSISGSTITGNSVLIDGGAGGAIFSYNSTLSITDSTILGNSAGDGGGIYSQNSNLSITDSSISENNTSYNGAGIYINNDDSEVIAITISNSTISENNASIDGGGIFIYDYDNENTATTISNSTITGNSANNKGGGIYNVGDITSIIDSTITGNTADTTGGVMSHDTCKTYISNSIISGNSSPQGAEDVDGVVSGGYNLLGDIDSPTGVLTDIISLNPKLAPLADNGGPTKTHALQKDSPAVDAGYSTIPLDQRGAQRDDSPDIGSYEYQDLKVNPAIITYLLN